MYCMNSIIPFPRFFLVFLIVLRCQSLALKGSINDKTTEVIMSMPQEERLSALKILSNEAVEISKGETIIQESNSVKHKQTNILNVPLWQIIIGLVSICFVALLLYLWKLKP